MRSAELARLAGVTVRTLRHYHQADVLDEPPRATNGYRDYDVRDLVRLLRIRRLTRLGIPLERIRRLLEDDRAAAAALADLEAELTARIAQLEEERAAVAELRRHGVAPDLPPSLAPFFAAFASAGSSRETLRAEREQMVLLAHLAGERGGPELARFYARLSDPDTVATAADLAQRFAALTATDPPDAVDAVVDGYTALLGRLLRDSADIDDAVDLGRSAHLVDQYVDAVLAEPQRAALDRIVARLADGRSRTTIAQGR